jgi:hypothetical protein
VPAKPLLRALFAAGAFMKRALLAAGAAAAAAVVYYATKADDGDDDVEEIPSCSRDEVIAIFNKLSGIMNQNISTLMRKINAQNAQIPQAMLAQYLVEHYETQLKEVQAVVFKEFGYDEDEVEEAVDYYEAAGPNRDEGVCEATNQLRQLYINVGGSVELDLPEDLTVEKMCVVFEDYMGAVVAAQAAFTEHLHALKAKGAQVTTAQLNETRQLKMSEKVGVVLKKHGLSNLVFQAAIEKFNDHPTFQAKIAAVKAADQTKK